MNDYGYVPRGVRLTARAQDQKFGMTGKVEALACWRTALKSDATELRGLHHHLRQTSWLT